MTYSMWTNWEVDAFLNREGDRKHLANVAIKSIDKKTERAELYGRWPMASSLLDIRNGDAIDITRNRCGQRSVFDPESIFMRLLHCRVKSINFPSPIELGEERAIEIHIGLDCDVEIVRTPDNA